MKCILWFLILVSNVGLAVDCPYTTGDPYAKEVKDIQGLSNTAPAPGQPSPRAIEIGLLLKINSSARCFVQYVLEKETPAARRALFGNSFKELETVRTDKQGGSSSASGGTTNLVSKGLTAQALSIATEYGAVKESSSNQTVTVQGSLDGIPAAAVRQNLIGYCPEKGPAEDPFCLHKTLYGWLRKLSYGVSFNASQPSQTVSGTGTTSSTSSAQPVTFTASGREISSLTGRFIIVNQRDATSQAFQKKWACQLAGGEKNSNTADSTPPTKTKGDKSKGDKTEQKNGNCTGGAGDNTDAVSSIQAMTTAANNLLAQLESFLNMVDLPLNANPQYLSEYKVWYSTTNATLTRDSNAPNFEEDGSVFKEHLDDAIRALYAIVVRWNLGLPQEAADFLRSSEAYDFNEQAFVESIANTPVLTAEYDDNRPQNQNSYSTVRVIYDQAFFGKLSLTGNGGFSINSTVPPTSVPGASRLRDAQVGAQLKYSLNTGSKSKGSGVLSGVFGAAAVSGTYYFQYQNSPAVLNVTPGTPLTGITITDLPSSATQVFAKKGNLHVGQLRLELGPSGSSVRIPLSVTYSNRTELITKPDFRGQIGISYDFDSLFSRGSGK